MKENMFKISFLWNRKLKKENKEKKRKKNGINHFWYCVKICLSIYMENSIPPALKSLKCIDKI